MSTLKPVEETNARAILGVVQNRGLPKTVGVICLMTAMTESGIRRLANRDGQGQHLPNDGVGWDHDSAGCFQQRPPWGPIEVRMDAAGSAGLFLDRLAGVDLTARTPWQAAQDVQVSAYDGHPRAANNHNAEYGGNYHGTHQTAVAITNELWCHHLGG